MVVTLEKSNEAELPGNKPCNADYISLENKIGEGTYREVYRAGDKALKILKPHIHKFNVDFPTSLFTKLEYGIADFNQYEYNTYQRFIKKIPEGLRGRFAKIYSAGCYNGRSASLSELITNENGGISKSLSKFGPVSDKNFWNEIDQLESLLLEKRIFLIDIRKENVMVKESEGKLTPVLFDYKRIGARTRPFQPWLRLFPSQLAEKVKIKFQELREEYAFGV